MYQINYFNFNFILTLIITLTLTLYLASFTVALLVLCNLMGQSIRTSMQNLESVAQKMAELLH